MQINPIRDIYTINHVATSPIATAKTTRSCVPENLLKLFRSILKRLLRSRNQLDIRECQRSLLLCSL
jgi:hypothetical protein